MSVCVRKWWRCQTWRFAASSLEIKSVKCRRHAVKKTEHCTRMSSCTLEQCSKTQQLANMNLQTASGYSLLDSKIQVPQSYVLRCLSRSSIRLVYILPQFFKAGNLHSTLSIQLLKSNNIQYMFALAFLSKPTDRHWMSVWEVLLSIQNDFSIVPWRDPRSLTLFMLLRVFSQISVHNSSA
jgi:hypothetical protein